MKKSSIKQSQYIEIHRWLKRNFGIASKCEMDGCDRKPKRYEWALKKGYSYEKSRENFMQLCPSCHRKYDMKDEYLKKLREPRRSVTHREPIKSIKLTKGSFSFVFSSTKEAAEKLNINRRSIYNVLAGRASSVGGYKVVKLQGFEQGN